MNTEIVLRLSRSLSASDKTNKLIARVLVRDLDREIVDEMVNIVRPVNAEHEEYIQELLRREAEAAGDAHLELSAKMEREGGPMPDEEEPE